MKNQKTALVGLILPVLPVVSYASLVLISFANNAVGSIIAVDKLILLTVVLSPVIFILGAIVSIIALFKSEIKTASLAGVTLNIVVLLIFMVCFSATFFTELKLVI